MRIERNPEKKMVERIEIEIQLGTDFPDKYKDAVIRAAESCGVKKHMHSPPQFALFTKTMA